MPAPRRADIRAGHVGRVFAARGTAVDRRDKKPADFTVLRIQLADKNEGAALFGVWKDQKGAEEVRELMTSIRIKKPDKEKKSEEGK